MKAGDITRAIQRNNGQLVNTVQQYKNLFDAIAEKRRQEQSRQYLMDKYSNYQRQLNDLNNLTTNVTTEKANPFYKPQPVNIPSNVSLSLGNRNNNSLAGVLSADNAQQFTSNPTYQDTESVPVSDSEKFNKAQNLSENFMMDMLGDPNREHYNPNEVNLLSSMIDKKAEQFRPSYTYRNLAEGAFENTYDKYGRLVSSVKNPKTPIAAKAPTTQKLADGTFGYWDNDQKKFISTGQKFYQKPSSKDGSEDSGLDISKDISDLEEAFGNYNVERENYNKLQEQDKLSKDKRTAKEYDPVDTKTFNDAKRYHDLSWNSVVAKTDGLANKINVRYPGFLSSYKMLYQNPKIKEKKNVDEAVNETMQGAPEEVKIWMKNLLKKRIF